MSETTRNPSTHELNLLDLGLARLHGGRLIPVMRGGDETPEEKAARETAEAKAKADAEAAANRMFTPEQQAAVDRIVQERLARAKAEPPADYEDLKAAAKRLEEIEAANKTELEKANERAVTAEAAAKAATESARETALKSAVIAEAAKKNVVDPDAALALLDRSTLTLDDNGVPTNVAEAMDALLTAKPYLAGTTRAAGDADQGARTGANGVEQLASTDGLSSAEIATALAEGRLDTYLTKPK